MRYLPKLTVALMALALLVVANPVQAQDAEREAMLRQQIMTRFMQRVRTDTGMDDAQFERFRAMTEAGMRDNQALQQRERELWQELQEQMRPGVAADPGRVDAIIEELVQLGEQKLANRRDAVAEYAEFLSPIQRAQVVMSFRWLEDNIRRIAEEQMGQGRRRGN